MIHWCHFGRYSYRYGWFCASNMIFFMRKSMSEKGYLWEQCAFFALGKMHGSAIWLFTHNQRAFISAEATLEAVCKVAMIHMFRNVLKSDLSLCGAHPRWMREVQIPSPCSPAHQAQYYRILTNHRPPRNHRFLWSGGSGFSDSCVDGEDCSWEKGLCKWK